MENETIGILDAVKVYLLPNIVFGKYVTYFKKLGW
jgi:hypothetical protein